jgi:hypothetical protein
LVISVGKTNSFCFSVSVIEIIRKWVKNEKNEKEEKNSGFVFISSLGDQHEVLK